MVLVLFWRGDLRCEREKQTLQNISSCLGDHLHCLNLVVCVSGCENWLSRWLVYMWIKPISFYQHISLAFESHVRDVSYFVLLISIQRYADSMLLCIFDANPCWRIRQFISRHLHPSILPFYGYRYLGTSTFPPRGFGRPCVSSWSDVLHVSGDHARG